MVEVSVEGRFVACLVVPHARLLGADVVRRLELLPHALAIACAAALNRLQASHLDAVRERRRRPAAVSVLVEEQGEMAKEVRRRRMGWGMRRLAQTQGGRATAGGGARGGSP